MGQDAELSCRCGQVHGRVKNASRKTVCRAVCYCDDCQAYLHYLGRADLLDAHGGTDVIQVAPASLSFDRGSELIVGLRLSPTGLFRWYSSCCKTPLGNTLSPRVPFVGIIAQSFDGDGKAVDEIFGRPVGAVRGEFAIGTAPEGSTRLNVRLIARALRKVLGWRIRGKTWPHPFFEHKARAPSHSVTTLSRTEREALRPLCGPNPTARAGAG